MVFNPTTRPSAYPDSETLDYIEHQAQQFDQMRPELLKQYQGQYIWFENGNVLDVDLDQTALVMRIYSENEPRPMLIKQVLPQDPQLQLRTPFRP
jgi:hypothetical protein